MIVPSNAIRRIGSTLFLSVPQEATQFFWMALEASVEFDSDPRWMRLVRPTTRLLAWIAGVMSFVLIPLALYSIVERGALALGVFSLYCAGVGSFGFFKALRGIAHDRKWRHIALTPEELSEEALISLANAQARPAAHHLNKIAD